MRDEASFFLLNLGTDVNKTCATIAIPGRIGRGLTGPTNQNSAVGG